MTDSQHSSTPVSDRLKHLGIELPPVAAPVACYVPAVRSGNIVYTSGQLPFVDGELPGVGKVGAEITEEQAYGLARIAALNALAAVNQVADVNHVKRIVKIVGFVASAPGFSRQPAVVNGASELVGDIFGEAGRHARSAVGVSELPLNSPVEIEIIAEVAD